MNQDWLSSREYSVYMRVHSPSVHVYEMDRLWLHDERNKRNVHGDSARLLDTAH